MSAIITDQFRINNASNFINSISDPLNSYYIFLGLCNPKKNSFGRDENWQESIGNGGIVPNPSDNFDYVNHYKSTILFGKRINSSSVRRVIRKINWKPGLKYDMYRHDYGPNNLSGVSQKSRLYDCNYYVVNSDYRVYICLSNGSSESNPTGNSSQDEPTFVDFEPSKAGVSGDGYIWKYLFTIPPSDIVKFDSTEYIVLPNDWKTSTDAQIESIRNNANSTINNNQIKIIYIENSGSGYTPGNYTVNILGDGVGGKAYIEVNLSGNIEKAEVVEGGSGYTYGIVDLGPCRSSGQNFSGTYAKLIPIIPPSLGHGYDIYSELGADKILIYSRFDDSTLDFPVDTQFSQIGIIKNPESYSSSQIYDASHFSNLYSLKLKNASTIPIRPDIGDKIEQESTNSVGYVASFNSTVNVLKYFKDRSLYYGDENTSTDYANVTNNSNSTDNFVSGNIITDNGFTATIDTDFNSTTETVNSQLINLDSSFVNGVSLPEINSKTGEIIYIDNRSLVTRNLRQKEDVKIILEF